MSFDSSGTYQEAELQGLHGNFFFLRTRHTVNTVSVAFYIPTHRTQGFEFLYTLIFCCFWFSFSVFFIIAILMGMR